MPVAAPDLAAIDLSDLALWESGPPHEVFARLRAEAPVHWSPLEGFPHEEGFWSVVRYEDIAAVGRDWKTFSSERGGILAVNSFVEEQPPGTPDDPLEFQRLMLISQDPPRHDRLKALVQRAFTPKTALDHADRIREIINLVYDNALERHPDGRIDLVQDVGIYVPAMVIGDMLGAPREDAQQLVDWTNRTTAFEDPRVVPDIATMNHAHTTHYTLSPDPAIKYVLRGWAEDEKPARIDINVGDVHVRNVPTNIRRWGGDTTERHGNSIFIFEIGSLCVAHLGHLHHTLTPQQLAEIGRIDVVLVPVDGSYTLDMDGMIEVLQGLKAPLMIPMHFFSGYTLDNFLARLASLKWAVERAELPTVVVSRATLPPSPKILVLPGR